MIDHFTINIKACIYDRHRSFTSSFNMYIKLLILINLCHQHDGLQESAQVPFTESNRSKTQLRKSYLLAYISQGSLLFIVPISRNAQIMLKIEFSLPKLFYGNNFQELKGKDLQPLLLNYQYFRPNGGYCGSPELAKAPVVSSALFQEY